MIVITVIFYQRPINGGQACFTVICSFLPTNPPSPIAVAPLFYEVNTVVQNHRVPASRCDEVKI